MAFDVDVVHHDPFICKFLGQSHQSMFNVTVAYEERTALANAIRMANVYTHVVVAPSEFVYQVILTRELLTVPSFIETVTRFCDYRGSKFGSHYCMAFCNCL